MREIKFRGKTYSGELVKGYYCVSAGIHCIYDETKFRSYEIIPETRGEFTGKHDKHENEIYEGDFLKYDDPTQSAHRIPYIVRLDEDYCEFECVNHLNYMYPEAWKQMEIVGNRWDNPEMLKEAGIDECK